MIHSKQERTRHGIVLPIVTVCLVGLMGFMALAIDIGVLAVARNQAQNAADIAALAGARTLNGMSSSNYNDTAAVAMAQTAATNNSILNTSITTAQVTTAQAGIYQYSTSAGRFQAVFGQTPLRQRIVRRDPGGSHHLADYIFRQRDGHQFDDGYGDCDRRASPARFSHRARLLRFDGLLKPDQLQLFWGSIAQCPIRLFRKWDPIRSSPAPAWSSTSAIPAQARQI